VCVCVCVFACVSAFVCVIFFVCVCVCVLTIDGERGSQYRVAKNTVSFIGLFCKRDL